MEKFYSVINSLEVGDRIIVPKSSIRWIQHHAIYLGIQDGYHWFVENKENIGVRVVNEFEFFEDVIEVTRIVKFDPTMIYSREDLVEFALSKIGTKYSLFNYNCESFANEIQHRVVFSSQVKTGMGLAALLMCLIMLIPIIRNQPKYI